MAGTITLLLVEDEPIIALAIQMALTEAGFMVGATVSSGERAIDAARQKAPDAILMDIRLAGELDGIEAARVIREFSAAPIIFMTGYRDKGTHDRARDLGPFLEKPIRLPELKTLLASLLA